MICEACEQPVRATGPRVYADDMSKVWHYRCHPTVAASPPGLSPGIASPDIQTREAQRAEILGMYRVREEDL